ncbi:MULTISPECIES: RnfH family protein [unclassified Halomonas]|uniref:RnfH family protein n=1 Tax=unclassified Halomonas TaxID=2609666 RepID=UPI0007DA27E1|nr:MULTISPECIES: RnfH family protein [unclassified Halomonas]MBT2785694.1 RnfH family protein [Halomonas sp. ISL-106]MBT2798748.1 RnfH family protein [Halomonas sp. ISL-104]OAL59117.1 RnfH family protein [Halomonas sp. ALS9]
MVAETLAVEVAYALPSKQRIVALRVPEGTTARQAVALADLPALFPEVPGDTFAEAPLGIFGKALRNPDTQPLRDGDRVEVYRPLAIDPKAARLERAKRQASDLGHR